MRSATNATPAESKTMNTHDHENVNAVLSHLARILGLALILVGAISLLGGCSVAVERTGTDVQEEPAAEEPEPFQVRESVTMTAWPERYGVDAFCPEGTVLDEGLCFMGGPGSGTLYLDRQSLIPGKEQGWYCEADLAPGPAERLTAVAYCVEVEP